MKAFIIFSYLLFIFSHLSADKIDSTKIEPWQATKINEYKGVYIIGAGKSEKSILLYVSGEKIWGQIKTKTYNKKLGKIIYQWEAIRNIRINNTSFISNTLKGNFNIYRDKKVLILEKDDNYEIGIYYSGLLSQIPGRHPITSMKKLDEYDIKNFTLEEIIIMRNEIFARYGFDFHNQPKMRQYFESRVWYTPQHRNVNKFLTEVELYNINFLKKIELLYG